MNFLAHAYLSFNDPDILIGNMIADLVKGKQIEKYSEKIQKGIHIHRQIDSFTDHHPVTLEAMNLLRPSAGRYAGAFLDVSYDHFLALDKVNEPKEGWQAFAAECYRQIELSAEILPSKFCNMFMYMKSENWFFNYRFNWMIERSFERLQSRATFLDAETNVFEDYEKHYNEISISYSNFFPELKAFAEGISL